MSERERGRERERIHSLETNGAIGYVVSGLCLRLFMCC